MTRDNRLAVVQLEETIWRHLVQVPPDGVPVAGLTHCHVHNLAATIATGLDVYGHDPLERTAFTLRLIDAALADCRRDVPAWCCEMCGSREDVVEDDAGTRLCGECSWTVRHPTRCPERLPGGGICGEPKESRQQRCVECDRRIYEEE